MKSQINVPLCSKLSTASTSHKIKPIVLPAALRPFVAAALRLRFPPASHTLASEACAVTNPLLCQPLPCPCLSNPRVLLFLTTSQGGTLGTSWHKNSHRLKGI